MTLQQLRYFVETCRCGSFAAAADALYLTQPSIADQVKRLEEELGVRLFLRSGRTLRLTEAGEALRPQAIEVLTAVDRAAASVSDVRKLRGGTASLGTFSTAYHYLVGPIVSDFASQHPDVSIRFIGRNSVEVAQLIRDGDLEAGLITLPIDVAGFELEPLMKDENLFATLADIDTDAPIAIKDLAERRLIVYDAHFGWRSPTRRLIAERAAAAEIELKPAIEVEHCEGAIALAANGFGDTIVTSTVTKSPRFPQALNTVRFEPSLYDILAFIWPEGARLSPATTELIRLTRQHLGALGDKPDAGDLIAVGMDLDS